MFDINAALAKTVSPRVTAEFKHGICFDLCYVPRARFNAIITNARELKYDDSSKARVEKLNSDKFLNSFLAEAVKGWSGVTVASISKIAPIDVSNATAEQLAEEIPYSQDTLKKLMEQVYDLDQFIQTVCMDISFFRPTLKDETKN